MTIIRKGGTDYRVDDLVALLENKIKNEEETEEEMNLYMEFHKSGPLVFAQKHFQPTVLQLISEVE